MKADCPLGFIDSVLNEFQKGKGRIDECFRISPSLCEITKTFICIEIPCCEVNEIKSKHFNRKFHKFTNIEFRIEIFDAFSLSKIKAIINCVLSILEMVHVALVIQCRS